MTMTTERFIMSLKQFLNIVVVFIFNRRLV